MTNPTRTTTAQAQPHHSHRPRRRSLMPNVLAMTALSVLSLVAGMAGYSYFEGLGAVDAFLNAAMILGGMGPVATIATNGGKIFAGLYALYSGLFVLISAGLILAPALHNVMHRFHFGEE